MTAAAGEPARDVLDTGAAGGMAIRGGVLRGLAYVGAMLLSLLSVPFMTRHLGEARYGYYVTAASLTFIISGITEAGLTNLGLREYSVRDGADRASFLRNLVGLRLVLTITGIALAVLVTALTGAPDPVVTGTAIMGAGMILALTQATYGVSLSSQLRLGWVSALELIRNAALSFAILAFVALGTGLTPFFWASVLSGAVVLALTLIVLRGDAGLLPAFHLSVWRGMLRDVLPYALAAAVGLIYLRLAVLLMSYLSTDEETGIYSAAFRVVETVAGVPWLVVSAAFPILARAARHDDARLRYGVTRVFEVCLLAGVGVSLALMIAAPFAIEVVAGDEFAESVPVLEVLSLALIGTWLMAAWSFALLSLARYRDLLVANAIAVVVAAGLGAALIPPLGAEGAALSTLAAELVLAIAYLVALVRARPGLAPSPAALARVLPGAAAMLAIWLLVPAHAVILAALATVAYVALAFAMRAVPAELLDALRRRDPGREEDPS